MQFKDTYFKYFSVVNILISMDVEELKRVITYQKETYEQLFKSGKIIPREVDVSVLKRVIDKPNALVILGIRRCGKSILSLLLLEGKTFGHINFFDERLTQFKTTDLQKVVQAFYELYGNVDFMLFDEIHYVYGWERFISRLRDTKHVVVTGSNSELLSGELATSLTGRYISFELFPFSFREFLKANGTELRGDFEYSTNTIASVKNKLKEYLQNGGFPELERLGRIMLQDIYSDILEKDIIRRYKLRKPEKLRDIARYLVSNSGGEITFNKLKNIFAIKDPHTAAKYVHYLSEAYLVFVLERFSYKLKQKIISPKKIYSIDTGLINAVSTNSDSIFGRLMETAVAIELKRRSSYTFHQTELYYWKGSKDEVDFLVKSGMEIEQLIQVTYASSKEQIREREISALVAASKETRCNNLMVLTWDYEEKQKVGGKEIIFLPIWKWLLGSIEHSTTKA